MKVAIYPGSFNPWHDGHTDVLLKALKVFDKVIVARGINPNKAGVTVDDIRPRDLQETLDKVLHGYTGQVDVLAYPGLLAQTINRLNTSYSNPIIAVVRGLRNTQDLCGEQIQQYWNEDLGLKIPTVYIVADRKLVHISSSAIRAVEGFKR